MKAFVLLAVATIALAVPAVADNSTSTVSQIGRGNAADINRDASITGANSLVDQSESDNEAFVVRTDYGSVFAGTAPLINASTIIQSGDGNVASLTQDTSPLQFLSTSYIAQIGVDNEAGVTQYDDAQDSSITQVSYLNTANVTQGDQTLALTDESYGNASSILQDGLGNHFAEVTQLGLQNDTTIEQFGAGNTIYVAQLWDFNRSFATQDGIDQYAEITQTGDGSLSELFQAGSGHRAYLLQSGNDNYSLINQFGADNWAWVSQGDNNNSSTVIQSGMGNSAKVSQ